MQRDYGSRAPIGILPPQTNPTVEPEIGLQQQFGYPVITATTAIRQALQFLGAKRIALGCPYPTWLLKRSGAHKDRTLLPAFQHSHAWVTRGPFTKSQP